MSKNATAPAGATLDNLARLCNRFFLKTPLQFSINDLVCWICGKPNPIFFPKSDARKRRIGAGVSDVLKGFFKLYKVGPTGRLVYERQFTPDLWIRITVKALYRLFGNRVTRHQYLYSRRMMIKVGILKTRLINNKRWGCELEIQIDFERLEEILEKLPELKREVPSVENWPLPPRRPVNRTPPIDRTPSTTREVVTTAFAGDAGSDRSEKKTLGCANDPVLKKEEPIIDFSNEAFTGKIDPEGEEILCVLRELFDKPITNGVVRSVNQLRRRQCATQLTFNRLNQYARLVKQSLEILPDWMLNLELEKLLSPGLWHSLAQELNRIEYLHADEDLDNLKEIESLGPEMEKLLCQLRVTPDAFWEKLKYEEWCYRSKDWMRYALYGWNKGWSEVVMTKIREKAKATLLKSPVLFSKTEHLVSWGSLLGMTEQEISDLRKRADDKVRALKWRVHMAREVGAL